MEYLYQRILILTKILVSRLFEFAKYEKKTFHYLNLNTILIKRLNLYKEFIIILFYFYEQKRLSEYCFKARQYSTIFSFLNPPNTIFDFIKRLVRHISIFGKRIEQR